MEETTQKLGQYESAELSESDKKIAKKRAKKHNMPVEIAEEQRKQHLNTQKAQELVGEFGEKLKELGFVLEPTLKFTVKEIRAVMDLRPLSAMEIEVFKRVKKEKEEKSSIVEDSNAEKKEEQKAI